MESTARTADSPLQRLLAVERQRHHTAFLLAAVCAGLLGLGSVALLGLSGWFITAAAAAGAAGVAAAQAFNYLLPSAGIRMMAIVRTGARYGERLASHEAALGSMARVRPALFGALSTALPEQALAVSTGEAVTAMVQDAETLEAQLVRRSAPWTALVGALTGLALVALGGWAPLLATLLCGTLLAAAAWLGARQMRAAAMAGRAAMGALKDELAWLAASDAELRCYALEGWAAERVATQDQALAHAQRRQVQWQARTDAAVALCSGAAAALAVALAREAGAPLAALCGLSAAMAMESLAPLLRHALQQGAADEASRRLDALLRLANAGGATPRAPAVVGDAAPATLTLAQLRARPLQPGSRVALVGPSGAGKSTLVETLLALRTAAPGALLLDGQDAATLHPHTLRAQFAWLPQDAALIAGTVRENLTLAGPKASDDDIWAALADAGLADRIRALPGQLAGMLGEDGTGLSGGERRRLALARAYLADAPWLLLDEPTEGLDAATEAVVVAGLARRLEGTEQGVILVSHRVAPLALCDRVVRVG